MGDRQAEDRRTSDDHLQGGGANAWMQDPLAVQQLHPTLQRHIVVLHVAYAAGDGSLPRMGAYTGFLLLLHDRLYWVTAAHCIKEVVNAQEDEKVEILKVELLDPRERREPGIPFPEFFDSICPYPDESLADIAVVRIPKHVRSLLEANRLVRALDEECLEGAEVVEGDALCLVGVPSDLHTSTCVEGEGIVELSGTGAVACLPVSVTRAAPKQGQDAEFWDTPRALYHEVSLPDPSSGGPQSVKGMSGGPVFSLKTEKDGRIRYRLVGVQSSWIKESRVLRIIPMRAVVLLIGLLDGWIGARCGAPTRAGRPCRNSVRALGERCRLHHER